MKMQCGCLVTQGQKPDARNCTIHTAVDYVHVCQGGAETHGKCNGYRPNREAANATDWPRCQSCGACAQDHDPVPNERMDWMLKKPHAELLNKLRASVWDVFKADGITEAQYLDLTTTLETKVKEWRISQ